MTTGWLEEAVSGPATDGRLTVVSNGKIPLGKTARDFVRQGADLGAQRQTAVQVARNYWGAGYDEDAATDALWTGLQFNNDPERDPWTWDEARAIAQDIYRTPAPPLKPWDVGVVIVDTPRRVEPISLPGDCSDVGNAACFRMLWVGRVLYDHQAADWWIFAGHSWRRDNDGEVVRLARETIRQRQVAAVAIPDDDARGREMKWAAGSLSRKRIADMLTLAQSEPGIADDGEGWDADPLLIAFDNGIYDAHGHTFRDGRPEDRIRTSAPAQYDPEARAPVFERFMGEIAPDEDVRRFLQRFLGYSLTADVSEQKMVIGKGPRGSNGKTTLAECMAGVMGPYAQAAAPEMLLTRKHDAHPTELADLRGARLVTSIEVEHGRRLAESRVKHLTGGDVIKARRMRENFSHFAPTHKLLLLCNHMPVITSSDEAIWRRLLVVEFSAKFADRPGPGERKTDPHLGAKLAAEGSGIVNWLIVGLKDWQGQRLNPPEAVLASSAACRAEADPLSAFFEEGVVLDAEGCLQPSQAYRAYRTWAAARWQKESEIISETVFGTMMGERFHRRRITVGGTQTRVYVGLRLPETEAE